VTPAPLVRPVAVDVVAAAVAVAPRAVAVVSSAARSYCAISRRVLKSVSLT